jgi:hypothetical protein
MKIKHALLIFLTGFLINIFGGLFKLIHLSFGPFSANSILMIGSIFETLGVLLFIYKIFTSPKFKDFLNW